MQAAPRGHRQRGSAMSHPAIRDRARRVEVANEFRNARSLTAWMDDVRETRNAASQEPETAHESQPTEAA